MAFAKHRLRRATLGEWTAVNPVLDEGEWGVINPDTGTGKGKVDIKIGDGITAFNTLPYAYKAADFQTQIDEITNNLATVSTNLGAFRYKSYTNNVDANTLTEGIIHCSTGTNLPGSYCGILTMANSGDGIQIALVILGNKLYTRTKSGGIWSAWAEK